MTIHGKTHRFRPARRDSACQFRTHIYSCVCPRGSGFGVTYRATATISVQNIEIEAQFAIKEHCEREGDTSRVKYSAPVR